ncbi:MAG: MBL fold metallo-hydrolase [Candidatus Shapirobacteria bacterium]
MKYRLILFLSLIILVILFWLTLPSKKVEVVFCDVGQGDAALVIYKSWQMMIDVGPNNKKGLKCLENNLPFWDKKLEVVLLTHGDSDHVGGLEDVSKFYKIEQMFSSENLNQYDVIKTDWISFEVVNPEQKVEKGNDNNENSVAGILTHLVSSGQGWSIFMSGDITADVERRLVWQKILTEEVDVLKVSHHGSKDGTTDELLEILKPKMAVISVGVKNKYGHPTKEVLDRLTKKGIEILRTDLEGDIIVNSF